MAEKAFDDLRRALCSEPVLVTPDFSLPLLVHPDASELGLGAVLLQVRRGEEHPVTYISRKLLSNGENYSTVEKEALAIKWALDKLKYYLLGREFTLVTDHAPLKWMASTKDTNAQITRWFLALQDFRFQVDHRPGRNHANPDALSRRDASLWSEENNPRLLPAVEECGNPAPTYWTGPPRGEVMDGRYHRFPPVGDRGLILGRTGEPDKKHLRWRRRPIRQWIKGCGFGPFRERVQTHKQAWRRRECCTREASATEEWTVGFNRTASLTPRENAAAPVTIESQRRHTGLPPKPEARPDQLLGP